MENQVHFDRDKQVITVQAKGRSLTIRKDDLEVSYFSGGKGGQNVNRHLNGVRLIYRIPNEFRMPNKKTTTVVTKSLHQRHQEQNLIIAFKQLADKLNSYFYVAPFRKKTKTPRRAKERRLENKKFQSQKKKDRKKVEF